MAWHGPDHSEAQRDREARAVKNHALFREVNERVEEINDGFSLIVPSGDWICECANDTCVERIAMSVNEYESVRRYGVRFFVAPSDEHLWPDVDQVIIDRNDRYWVIEETGHAGDLAKRSDPRSQQEPLSPPQVRTNTAHLGEPQGGRLSGLQSRKRVRFSPTLSSSTHQ